jgi:hypothetical protein
VAGDGRFYLNGKEMNYPEAIGRYYQALGVFSVATPLFSVATAYWTDWLHLDLSFIIWLWLGSALRERSRTARRWAIGISGIVWIALMAMLVFMPEAQTRIGSMVFGSGEPGFYIAYGSLFVLFFPGFLLFLPTARRQFEVRTEQDEGGAGRVRDEGSE